MANTPSFNWETPDDTDLVKDGAAAIRTLGNAIDSSMTDLKGGTTGQVLSKASNTDMDFTWVAQDDSNAIQNAIVDAKGDLITATAADTPARLAVGADGKVLKANSSTATGLEWGDAGGGGYTLLSTTSMSGSSSVTVSSISGDYKHLYICSQGAYQSSSSSALTYTLNGSTALLQWRLSMSNTTLTTGGTYEPTAFDIGTLYSSSGKPLSLEIFIPRYTDTSIKKFHYVRTHTSSGGTWSAVWGNNAIDSTSAITSFTISAGANFAGGTIWIYGVN